MQPPEMPATVPQTSENLALSGIETFPDAFSTSRPSQSSMRLPRGRQTCAKRDGFGSSARGR